LEYYTTNRVFKFILKNWENVLEFEKVLKFFYDVTNRLQRPDYKLSDFYGDWLLCELKLNKWIQSPTKTDLCVKLLEAMNERKSDLINNRAMLCAIFLDPRYKFNLTADQVALAKILLCDTWNDIKTSENLECGNGNDDLNEDICSRLYEEQGAVFESD
jgi:hypothetical protein